MNEENLESELNNLTKEEIEESTEKKEIDEDLEFLKAQLRHKKMVKEKKQQEEPEDYSYIKRFKINSIIEIIAGIIALIFGLLTKNVLMECLGITVICFAYLFHTIAKRGEKKREGNNKK